MSDDPEHITFIESDERCDEFQTQLIEFIKERKELGPIVHVCLISQILGAIVASNLANEIEAMRKSLVMNFDHGVTTAMIAIMESQQGEPN